MEVKDVKKEFEEFMEIMSRGDDPIPKYSPSTLVKKARKKAKVRREMRRSSRRRNRR